MNVSRTTPARLPSLAGFGFVALCMVLISHVGISLILRVDPTAQTLWSYDFKLGVMGFTFFFVLTGFALTWVHDAGVDARRFWGRRVARVFPGHVITLVGALLLAAGAGAALSVWRTVPTLLLVQNWIPDPEVSLTGNPNGPTWALSCALLFYAVFPWLNRLVRRIRPERLGAYAFAVVLVLVAVPLVAKLLPAEPLLAGTPDPWWQTWFTGYLPVARMPEFLLGMFAARMVATGRWRGPGVGVSVLLCLAGLAVSAQVAGENSGFAVTAVPLTLLVAAAARREAEGGRTVFGARPLVALGGISFGAYLVHWVVISYGPIHTAVPANWTAPLSLGGALGKSAVTVVAVLALGWLLTVLVERPAVRLLSGRREGAARDGERAAERVG
ncbi:acyltransferase [Streptomyces sp. NBC_00249]|uniref:acyltransferase family protein n=1 Tax=Streptomyces sp. NBC_00249 TaxID=2975690 RepID=UPI002258CC71|nr:acyltransferase [Streptomyces sp. NBC_00249]MCX5199519.1 acyltransferase [Streptomyces sp. NBC_00249]